MNHDVADQFLACNEVILAAAVGQGAVASVEQFTGDADGSPGVGNKIPQMDQGQQGSTVRRLPVKAVAVTEQYDFVDGFEAFGAVGVVGAGRVLNPGFSTRRRFSDDDDDAKRSR